MDEEKVAALTEAQLRRSGCTCAVQIVVRTTEARDSISIKHEGSCALVLRNLANWN